MEPTNTQTWRKVFCPTHKAAFDAPSQPRVVCEIVEHILTDNFARAEYWEYCCNCQTYWPSHLGQGGPAAAACPSCGREFARRYLCHECKLLSVESDEVGKGRVHNISPTGISPNCPNCGSVAHLPVHEHRCEEAQALLLSAHMTCRVCEVSVVKTAVVPPANDASQADIRSHPVEPLVPAKYLMHKTSAALQVENPATLPSAQQSPAQGINPLLFVMAVLATAILAFGGAYLVLRTPPASSSNAAITVVGPQPTPTKGTTANTTPNAPLSPPANRSQQVSSQEVAAALEEWAAAHTGGLDTYMMHYADTMTVYYSKRNVPASAVRNDKARAFGRYSSINVELSNLDISVQSETVATAIVDKAWHFVLPDGRTYSGKVRQQVWLEKHSGEWLIAGEKDLQLYYKN